jgi:hypothetical protein
MIRNDVLLSVIIAPLGLLCGRTPTQPVPEQMPDGIAVLYSAPSEVRVGDSLVMRLTVRNDSTKTLRLDLNAQKDWSFDPVIRTDDVTLVWQRGMGALTLVSTGLEIILSPKTEQELTAVWNHVSTGSAATGVVHVTPRLLGPSGSPIWTGPVQDVTIRP